MSALTMEGAVLGVEAAFNQVNAYKLNFRKEANFALQLLKANDYLRSSAQDNPDSLQAALTNIAAIGISLNPATKEAYLVPRKLKKDGPPSICLDISALGLIKLATDSGSVRWVQAEVVREKDTFKYNGVGKSPDHVFDPFSDRGPIVGVYVVAKTHDNEFLVTVMSIKECHEIRDRSEAWKAYKDKKIYSCPWVTDEGEMCKKTVIKRASKLWPKSERIDNAIHVVNEHEGIDFEREKLPFNNATTTDTPDEKVFKNIRDLLEAKKRTEQDLIDYMNTQFGLSEEKKLLKIEDFHSAHVDYAYRLINSMGAK